jgi:hypothetical protein
MNWVVAYVTALEELPLVGVLDVIAWEGGKLKEKSKQNSLGPKGRGTQPDRHGRDRSATLGRRYENGHLV